MTSRQPAHQIDSEVKKSSMMSAGTGRNSARRIANSEPSAPTQLPVSVSSRLSHSSNDQYCAPARAVALSSGLT